MNSAFPSSEAVASLDALFADLVETLANAALKLDDAAADRLAALEGRRLRILCRAPAKTVTLGVQRRRLSVSAEAIGEADVSVCGSASELFAWAFAGLGKASGQLEIAGDEALLAEFAAALRPTGPGGHHPHGCPTHLATICSRALELGAAMLGSAAQSGADALRRGFVKNGP